MRAENVVVEVRDAGNGTLEVQAKFTVPGSLPCDQSLAAQVATLARVQRSIQIDLEHEKFANPFPAPQEQMHGWYSAIVHRKGHSTDIYQGEDGDVRVNLVNRSPTQVCSAWPDMVYVGPIYRYLRPGNE